MDNLYDVVYTIIKFINDKNDKLYTNWYKKEHVYNYCVMSLSILEDKDKAVLKEVIKSSLYTLVHHKYIAQFKRNYMTIKSIDNIELFKNLCTEILSNEYIIARQTNERPSIMKRFHQKHK